MSTSDVLTKNLQELEKEKPVIRRMITEVFNQINEKTIDAYDLVKKTLELAKRVADYRAKFKASADYGREHGLPFDSEKYELINTDYHQKLDKIYEVADKTKQDIKKINIFEMTIQDDATKAKNEPSKSNITNQQVQQETITMTTEAEPKTMPEKFILKEIEKIKPFSGKFLDFRKFFESLTSLLDLSCLPPQRKIDIIAEKLDGPSRQLINSMGDEDDYDKVKTILREKFYDPYEVVLHIAQQLRSLPKLTNNFDIMGMERILEDIKKTEKLMTKVNINPAYTYQFKRIIYQKLTYEIVSKLGCVSETDLSTIVEVLEKEHKLARSRREDHNLFDDFLSCGPIVKTSPQRQNTRSTYCYFCSSPTHTSVDCRARIPLKTKRNIIWEKNLCIRCLEKGHRMSNCGSERVCRICRGGHHEILCQTPQQDNPRCTNQSNVNKGNYRSITSPQRKMIEYPQRQSNTPRTKVKESYVCETMNTTSNDMRSQVQQNSDTNERKEMKNTKPDDYEVQTMEDELIGLSNLESNMLHMMMAKTETTDMAKRKDLEEPVVVKAQVNGFEQELMIDSGANISFITPMYVKKLLLKEKPSNENIITLGSNVHIKGICTTTVKIENIEHEVKFYVVPHEKDIIALGRDAMRSFGISIIPEDENKWKVKINIGQGKEKDVEDHDIGKLLKKYKDVFAKNKEDIGCIKNEMAQIHLSNEIPITCRPYPCTAMDQEIIDKEIDRLLKMDVIEPSNSPFCFPIVLVDKKDEGKKTRLCVDYRKLNDVTIVEHYPMPKISDIDERLINSTYFTTLDISQGYYHVMIDPDDRGKTGFVTKYDQYQWKRLPFGLKNAPMIFQRIIWSLIKRNNLHMYCHNYIDDIIIFSRTKKEHLTHLDNVMNVLLKENIKLKLSKCIFGMKSIIFLGHKISEHGIAPCKSNIEAIIKAEPPKNLKDLRGFLGKINYYHKFIPNRAETTYYLTELLKKNQKWEWTENQQKEFENLKNLLIKEPILKLFNPKFEIKIYTDASLKGIGAVLKQIHPNEQEYPVAYFSKKLLPYQQRYSASELECLAILEAVEYWHYWLIGQKFTIVTDHKPLESLKKIKKPKTRLFNWALRLSSYQFTIVYRKGADNQEADYLSRHPIHDLEEMAKAPMIMFTNLWEDTDKIIAIQKNYNPKQLNKCYEKNGIIYRKKKNFEQIFIPKAEAENELRRIHHEFGHIGSVHLYEHYSRRYYTPDIMKIIKKVVQNCEVCNITKKNSYRFGFMGQIGPAKLPFEIVHIDTIGGFQSFGSNKRFLHLAIDAFTRFIWIICSRTQTAKDMINLVKKIQSVTNPKLIIADQYPAIKGTEFKTYLNKNNISIMFIPRDHPSSNGIVERVNQTICDRIRHKIYETSKEKRTLSWATHAAKAAEEYNKTIHSVTKYSPLFLLTGYDAEKILGPEEVVEARKIAFQNSNLMHEKNKKKYDETRKELPLEIIDEVYVSKGNALNRKKLDARFEGPFPVVDKEGNTMLKIQKKGKLEKVHISQVKPKFHPFNMVLLTSLMLIHLANGKYEPSVADPIVWEKTDHTITKELVNTYYYIRLVNPCSILKRTDRRFECNARYDFWIMETINKNCDKINITYDDFMEENRRRKRFVGSILKGTKFLFENYDKVLHIGQTIVGFVTNWFERKKIKSLKETQRKQQEQIKVLMNSQKEILKEMVDKLDKMGEIQMNNRKTMEDLIDGLHYDLMVGSQMVTISQNLKKFFNELARGIIPIEFELLFPGIVTSEDKYEQWEFVGCDLSSHSDLILEFIQPQPYDELIVYESHPFTLYKQQEDKFCMYEYSGPRYMLYNLEKDCVKRLHLHPHHKKRSESFIINKPTSCQEDDEIEKLWVKKFCETKSKFNQEELQIHYNNKFIFVYCYKQLITIENITSECENKIYKIPQKKEFIAGSFHHRPSVRKTLGNHSFHLYENELIGKNLYSGIYNYSIQTKNIDQLLAEMNNLDEPEEDRFNKWLMLIPTGVCLLIIIAGVLIVILRRIKLTKKKRKILERSQEFIELENQARSQGSNSPEVDDTAV